MSLAGGTKMSRHNITVGLAVVIAATGLAQAQVSPGDMNCDGTVNALDVPLFVECVLTGNCNHCGVVIDTVTVGNPGNADDPLIGLYGGVGYTYNIGKYEVTAGQYAEFLNAVAATDTYGLYNSSMDSDSRGCQITQNGSSGSYTYDFSGRPSGTEADWVDRPVNYVSWGDAARFANWLHNGQPTGAQDLTTTEDGSYLLDGAISGDELLAITREPDATWVIPSEDEWYKAAYHKNDGVTGNYWEYPTESNTMPTQEAPPGTDMTNGSANYYDNGYAIGSPYYRTEVGAYDAKPSDSPYGTFDQGGNVWEWNEVVFSGGRGVRGGSFADAEYQMHSTLRNDVYPTNEGDRYGFRVAEVP
jgi:formylglycine-generating enzyme required for sulfatase activity